MSRLNENSLIDGNPMATQRSWKWRCSRVAGSFLVGLLLVVATASSLNAQEATEEPGNEPERRGVVLQLPASLPDGRPLVPIGLFQSQMDELIPDDYRPVSIEKLAEAIARWTDRAAGDQASRLKSSVYWVEIVGDTLVSDRSEIDIESDRDAEVRRSLGMVNLAIEQSRGVLPATNLLPRLESDSNGNLVAVFRGDAPVRSAIEFKWRLRGKVSGSGYTFKMQLPRTPQTRIVFSAPPGLSVRSDHGVLRSRPGPPPDAGEFERSKDLRWYELDAGGLASVTIHTQQEQPISPTGVFVIRRSVIQYDADPGGLNWTARMVVQLAPGHRFPPLVVGGTTVMSVNVNSSDILFTSKTVGGRVQHLQLDTPHDILNGSMSPLHVTVTGYSAWNDRKGWCDLPMPVWSGEGVVHASAVDVAQLSVADSLQVMTWQLPADWKQSPQKQLDAGTTLLAADGPPVATRVAADKKNGGKASAGRPWSRVRFSERSVLRSSHTMLRLEVGAAALNAQERVSIELEPDRIEPLRFQVEPNWTCDAVTFVNSGRVIENPIINEKRVLVLWPEAEDVSGSTVVIEAVGSRGLPGAPANLTVPATWFLRPQRVRGELVAAVIPPDDLNWSGDAAMQQDRVKVSELTDAQRKFLASASQETLWFKPRAGRTPSVSLQTPSVSFNAKTVLRIRRDGDDIVESLDLEIESEGQSLKELVVQTGVDREPHPFVWSISGTGDTPSIGLPSSDVSESEGSYTIDVSDKNLRGRRLIARRRYPAEETIDIQLPSVPGAASQTSEAVISPGLLVTSKPLAVQLVPLERPAVVETSDGDSSPSNEVVLRGSVRLRYDAVQQPVIRLAKSDVNPNVTIVWREQIRVEASSRGTDRIAATYTVSPAAPFTIAYDPNLQLDSITRDGQLVDLVSIPQRPIVLQPKSDHERIQVVWNRSQFGSNWSRQCRIPRILVSGTVLKSEYQLIAAADAFAPVALLQGKEAGPGRASSIAIQPGEDATLIRRNIALAIGWLIALLVFAACWFIAERSPSIVAGIVVVSTAVLFLWWPWRLAVIGWLIVPTLAAAMLATARSWGARSGRGQDSHRRNGTGSISRTPPQDRSTDFSLQAAARFLALLILVSLFLSVAVTAQDVPKSTSPSTPGASLVGTDAIVLIPMDRHGKPTGKMVYIPQSLHTQLFQKEDSTGPQDASFLSANYRVMIDPTVADVDRVGSATVEAEYVIQVEGNEHNQTVVRLPLSATSVRRLELVDDVSRIKPFRADAKGQVLATLPPGSSFRLRATLIPEVSVSEPWTKLSVAIPAIASARLAVESEQNLDALRVDGRLLQETDLRRWTDELGPSKVLEVEYRTLAKANAAASKPLQRRYWVHAGKRQVAIDCEVDPPTTIAAGETFQFVIRDAAIPNLTSSTWRLDGSEEYSPTRRLMTFTCLRDDPGPIRLLWTRPSPIGNSDDSASESIRIPEVIAAAFGENSPAWIALHCDSALQFNPFDRDQTESLSVDHFLAAWSGYRGRIDRAYVALDELPDPLLRVKSTSIPSVRQSHHLHVTSDRLVLRYTATLTPSDANVNRYTIRIPQTLQLVQLTVDGQVSANRPVPSGAANDVLLGSFSGSEPVLIEAVAIQRLSSNLRLASPQFTPPRMYLFPNTLTSDQYTISRDRSTVLREIKPPRKEIAALQQPVTADSLAQGWIPVSAWVIPPEQGRQQLSSLGGVYEVKKRQTRFDSRQLIVLERTDNQWTMETLVRFGSKRIPDFIDVEVPTRWCESLEVSPASAWSRQPATDPARQIIRIRCDSAEMRDAAISIRGQLQGTETARVSVPSVRVLGFGQRQISISVPSRLTNELVQWRTSAVEAVELPGIWKDRPIQTDRSTYQVANPSWSIDLAPLPEIDAEAVAVNGDAQVFAQNEGVLVMSHWDLFPGSLEAAVVRLPEGASHLGAWSAGQAVVPERVSASGSSDPADADLIRVPLSLSRLSQPVELLIRVPAESAKQSDYLPELVGIPVTQQWLTNYESSAPTGSMSRSESPTDLDRSLALARAAVEAVESLDMVAQRPRAEIAAWLELWLARYRLIASSAGHVVDLNATSEQGPAKEANRGGTRRDSLLRSESPEWRSLDARIAVYTNRFLADDDGSLSGSDTAFLFAVGSFDGFASERVARLSDTNRPHPVQPISVNDRGFRKMVVNGLTLVLISGLLVCLRPFRRFVKPVVTHPALWLALMGLFGFAVAPVSVAAAILLVAVSLPVFPAKQRSPSS